MKVAILGNPSSTHIQKWVEILNPHLECLTVFCNHDHYEPLDGLGVKVVRLPFSGVKGYILNLLALKKYLGQTEFDILHAHYASGYGLLAMLTGFPYMISAWGSDVFEFPDRGWLNKKMIDMILMKSLRVTSSSFFMRDRIIEIRADVKDKIDVVPFGVDVEVFHPKDMKREYIGFVKSINFIYGVDILVHEYAQLRSKLQGECPDLLIIGDGKDLESLNEIVMGLEISGNVHFLGKIENKQLPLWFNRMIMYVLPSVVRESFGVTAIEAMACSTPCIVSNAGGPSEIVGELGLIVDVFKSGELCKAMEVMLKDDQYRDKVGILSRDKAEKYYSSEAALELMLSVYRGVVSNVV